ncbi:MAG: hypothetical protein R3275_10995 [Saprospiraceae bacterium]|nr:hypothetical protein [Saprospiraceae bacterium]
MKYLYILLLIFCSTWMLGQDDRSTRFSFGLTGSIDYSHRFLFENSDEEIAGIIIDIRNEREVGILGWSGGLITK